MGRTNMRSSGRREKSLPGVVAPAKRKVKSMKAAEGAAQDALHPHVVKRVVDGTAMGRKANRPVTTARDRSDK